MGISMIGIDHNMAPVDIRALFAFTKKSAGEAMEKIKSYKGIYGCVILSTCNRLEVWASVDEEEDVCLYDCVCQLKGISDDSYRNYFVERKDEEAVEHLFYLTSGLKSQIIGRRSDSHTGKRCSESGTGEFRGGRSSGGAVPYGGHSRKEDQDRGAFFPWKSFCDPPGNPVSGTEGIFHAG